MKFKLNDMEKKWILYDVGNSAFTLLIATIMPIYFNYLADQAGISEVNYLAYWGICHLCCYHHCGSSGSCTWRCL